MRGKGLQPILVALTTLLFLAHHIEGQEVQTNSSTAMSEHTPTAAPVSGVSTRSPGTMVTIISTSRTIWTPSAATTTTSVGIFIVEMPACALYTVDRAAVCAGFSDPLNLTAQLADEFSESDACSFSIKDFACVTASVPPNIVAAALKCAITDPESDGDPTYTILLFSKLTLDNFRVTLNLLATKLSGAHITLQGKDMMMKAAWQRLHNEDSFYNTGFLSSWFQERLHLYISAINQNILNCMASLSCDGLEAMVQALDIVYDDLENTTVLMIIGWIETTLAARGGCPRASMAEWIAAYWNGFSNATSLSVFTQSWSGFNVSEALDVLDSHQLAEYAVTSEVLMSESKSVAVISTLNARDVGYVLSFLDNVQALVAMPEFDHQVLYSLLSITMRKVTISFPDVCVATLKQLFQLHLRFLLVVIDKPMLDLIPRFIGCSDYHDIANGLDAVFEALNEDQQRAVLDYKIEFLANQTLKDGSACTLMHENSTEWLDNNLGPYSFLLSFQEIVAINHNFIGFDAAELLSGKQLAELVVESHVLVDTTVQDAEMKVDIVLENFKDTFEEFTSFVVELNVQTMQAHIDDIIPSIRCKMMNAMWEEIAPHFGSFDDSDYETWIGERFKLFTACITTEQIYKLPSTVNCTTLHVIVHSFNAAFDNMNSATQRIVAKWIFDYLNVTQCPSDNWLSSNFEDFSVAVTVQEIMCLNPSFDLLSSVEDLTPEQNGYAAVVIPGALETVTIMNTIFDAVTNQPTQEEIINSLGVFWDSFTVAHEQLNINITYDVKYTMFIRTTDEIQTTYKDMQVTEFTQWFERFDLVIESINSTILDQVPLTISCEKYEALIAAINMKFPEIKEENIKDVFQFIKKYLSQPDGDQGVSCSVNMTSLDWLQKSLGSFSSKATYLELKTFNPQFNVFEGEVLTSLTVDQVSDVLVYSTALTSMTETKQIFQYFENIDVTEVKSCMESFTATVSSQPLKPVTISSDIGEYFVDKYLLIIEDELITYDETEWSSLFEYEIKYFVSYFSSTSLNILIPLDCGSLMKIMNQLNTAFSKMADKNRKAVVSWFVNIFAHGGISPFPKDCQNNYTQSEWMLTVWNNFLFVANLSEIETTYAGFDMISALPILDTSQKIEFIVNSHALTNTTLMNIVLDSMSEGEAGLSIQTADEFLTAINVAIEAPGELLISREVNELITEMCFTAVSEQFQSFTVEDYKHYFEVQFKHFLIYIKVELIIHLQIECSCDAFSVIIQAFDSVFGDLPEDVKIAISDFIRRFLEYHNAQLNAAGNVCSTLYHNATSSSISMSYLEEIFYSFRVYFNVSEFHTYFAEFNSYDVLDSFSPEQLAEQMVQEGLLDDMNAALILVNVKTLTYDETVVFLTEFNALVEEKNMPVLPNENVQNLLFKVCFDNMQEGIQNKEEYGEWFAVHFQKIISSISVQNIMSIPTGLDCSSQEHLVSGFGKNFEKLNKVQGEAIHQRIVLFLKAQGPACAARDNSTKFITKWFGDFKEFASIAEFKELNPNFDASAALEVCTPGQIGEYVMTSGALHDEQAFVEIFKYLQTTEEVSSFVTELNTNAKVQLETTEIGSVIFSCITSVISEDYATFVEDDWTFWYQEQLTYLLVYVNETILLEIPSNIDCGSEQTIVKAFNGVFDMMSEEVQKSVYNNLIKRVFEHKNSSNTGVICGNAGMSSMDWININFGHFSKHAYFGDFLTWNKFFAASDMVGSLSVEQLADYTLDVNVLTNDDLICPILARLHHQSDYVISTFLTTFYQSAQKKSFTTFPDAAIRKKMYLQFIGDLQVRFSTYTSEDWTSFFQTKMALFWGSIDVQTATSIVQHLNCDAYRQFVDAIDASVLSPNDQADIFHVFLNFLENQLQMTGSACSSSDEGDLDAIHGLFGSFASIAIYDDMLTIRPDFNGLSHLSSLNAAQIAGFCLSGNNINDYSTMSVVMNSLRTMSIGGLQSFGIAIHNIASQKGITVTNTQVRDAMLHLIMDGVHGAFAAFTPNDWSQLFSGGLSLLSPSINATALHLIPENIDCTSLQNIIAALSQSYNHMTAASKQDVNDFVISHLAWQKEKTGSPCTANSDGSAQWINMNFGPFSDYCYYNDFITLNPVFNTLSAVNEMTPQQLAQYLASDSQNPAAASKVIEAVAPTSFGAFLDEFNARLHQSSVAKLTNADVRRILLEGIFCRIGPLLQTFTAGDYTEWFQNKLSYLIISLNAKVMGSLPTDLQCSSLGAIVHVLSQAPVMYDHPEAIWDFIVAVLTMQKSNTGNACASVATNDREWLTMYFGTFSSEFTVDIFISLKSNFRGDDCYDILTASQLSSLSVQSSFILNTSAINLVFSSEKMKDISYLSIFLDELRTRILVDNTLLTDNRIAATILMNTFETVGPMLGSMPLSNVTHLLAIIDFLLPYINSTVLDYVPNDISCTVYQRIVQALDGVYSDLSMKSKLGVLSFQTDYLREQAAIDGSACAHGITTTNDWILKNLGHFCEHSNGTEFETLFESFNLVSYNNMCLFA
ncbi:uncharacterized protein [Pleurodeles waltl]|uniref:uncharacterized protein isoform X1 n=1 Tax=Pleurodeles waltl TaxID=8319 RepID=UPI003709807D